MLFRSFGWFLRPGALGEKRAIEFSYDAFFYGWFFWVVWVVRWVAVWVVVQLVRLRGENGLFG